MLRCGYFIAILTVGLAMDSHQSPTLATSDRHAVVSNSRGTDRDLELVPATKEQSTKFVEMVIGTIMGGTIGLVVGSSTIASSGREADAGVS